MCWKSQERIMLVACFGSTPRFCFFLQPRRSSSSSSPLNDSDRGLEPRLEIRWSWLELEQFAPIWDRGVPPWIEVITGRVALVWIWMGWATIPAVVCTTWKTVPPDTTWPVLRVGADKQLLWDVVKGSAGGDGLGAGEEQDEEEGESLKPPSHPPPPEDGKSALRSRFSLCILFFRQAM